ncbi:MAG: hypothetical protein ACQES1_00465 [Bacteroidota bacterium]
MKRIIGIILTTVAIAAFLISCSSTEECPAYNNGDSSSIVDHEQSEQSA